MKNTSFVKDIMNPNPITINAETPVVAALDTLLDNQLTSAPVVDFNNRLVGFFSAHDVMVDLWCEDYIPAQGQKVVDLMSRDVVAIGANDRLVDVVEFMCIDKEKLFPTSNMGIATRLTSLSLEERAKSMKVSKPQVLPVLEDGQMVGVITRREVLNALRPVYGERLNLVEQNELESA